jgi:hypothetical protein
MDVDLQRHLLPGEHVVWEGHPPLGLVLRSQDIFFIPFGLIWCWAALAIILDTWTADDVPPTTRFVPLALLVGGLHCAVGRFWTDMRIRRRLRYVVTNRRILFLNKGRASASQSLEIKRLSAIELDERSDGSGTIMFGSLANSFEASHFWSTAHLYATPQFFRVPNVRAVYELIQRNAD